MSLPGGEPVQKIDKGLQAWMDGVKAGAENPQKRVKWNAWDCFIQRVVTGYNNHLRGKGGFVPLHWHIVKAMIWTETGAEDKQWNIKPMQIGVPTDPGMKAFLFGNEGGDLILPPEWRKELTEKSVRTNPEHNIRCGTGYLLMRMASYGVQTFLDEDRAVRSERVIGGDNWEKIARRVGTTVDVLKKMNPGITVLRGGKDGHVLKYQKAAVRKVITGWFEYSTQNIAKRYNGGGDKNYKFKLEYTLGYIRKGPDALCKT